MNSAPPGKDSDKSTADGLYTYRLDAFAPGNPGVSIGLQSWRRNVISTLHRHDCIEIVFVLSGGGFHRVGDDSFPVIAGDVFIIDQENFHAFETDSAMQFYNLMFTPEIFTTAELEELRENTSFARFFLPPSEGKIVKFHLPELYSTRLREYLDLLYEEFSTRNPTRRLACKSLLVLLLAEFCRIYERLEKGRILMPGGANSSESALPRILEELNRRLTSENTLPEIAAAVHLSPGYLSRFFKAETGLPLIKYLNTLKLEKARQLLLNRPDLNITEVANQSGFQDSSYFTRYFRRIFKETPTEFRSGNLRRK